MRGEAFTKLIEPSLGSCTGTTLHLDAHNARSALKYEVHLKRLISPVIDANVGLGTVEQVRANPALDYASPERAIRTSFFERIAGACRHQGRVQYIKFWT